MATRFKLDKKAFGIHVLQSDGMRRAMRHFAEPVKTRAEQTAPVDTGEYQRSFYLETSVRTVPPYKTKRAVATVGNTSDHSIAVEFGNGHTPRHRTLGRALGKF